MKPTIVTAALPYANGPVHIGHLAGAYLPSDIYVRFLRLRGEDVVFICGSDEHGVPITLRARKEGITPQQVVDKYHSMIMKSFEEIGVSFDIYHRTSEKIHAETASDFFTTLYNKKVFTQDESEQYYDEEAGLFLADRYITGTCPNCGNTNAYGDQCEKCGKSLSPADLINPHSQLSGKAPIKKKTTHWYLPLDTMQTEWLDKWIRSHEGDWKNNVFGQCKSWLDQGLQPRAVTRDLDWGVPVPLPDAKGKVLYVWFDAPIGYISATKALFEQRGDKDGWKKYWMNQDARLLHFIGKDNIVFHCIIFPAMLKAHGDFILPENVPSNEFLNLEGDKISTSRNWAVWLHEYLEEFPGKQDVLRYVLCATAPENKDNDFTWKDFQARNNNELVAILGNFVNRTLVLTQKYYNGKVPPRHALHDEDKACIDEMRNIPEKIEQYILGYRFRDALFELMNLARVGNKYLADSEPWKLQAKDPQRVETILNISLELTAQLASIMSPFLPFTSTKLLAMLNITACSWKQVAGKALLEAGHQLNEPALLFEKIEDDVIEKQIQKLQSSKAGSIGAGSNSTASNSNKSNQISKNPLFDVTDLLDSVTTQIDQLANPIEKQLKQISIKPSTSFDDFSKMDIRIGTILTAERVPKTDKLLKLTIDTGIDKRTVVSGIAAHYDPEKIIGQQVTILVNLEPRKIKGIESQGMILMAENANGELAFVAPVKGMENGGSVK